MSNTPPPGFEPLRSGDSVRSGDGSTTPATFGGAGWRRRRRTHSEEMAAGFPWSRCGVFREYDPLRAVLLAWPGEEFLGVDSPDEWLMLESIDLKALQREAERVRSCFEALGIEVHVYRPPLPPPPNLVFLRDLFFMTPGGAVLARTASEQRAGEERFAAHALGELGVPILHTVRGGGVFEGADALWLDERTVLAGVGLRTDLEGLAQVECVLSEVGASLLSFELPDGVQHLLGILNFVDRDLAAVRKDELPGPLRGTLESRGVALLELPASDEVVWRGALNFVTIGPRHIVMPAGCPESRRAYEKAGIICEEVEVVEYPKAAGGLGCLTGVLWRG